MTDIQAIQEEIMAGYAALTLPNSLGTPSTQKHEPDGGFASGDLPAVVVTQGIKSTQQSFSSEDKLVTREFIIDLYCYAFDDADPVNETSRNNTIDCIETIEQAFRLYGLATTGVFTHEITADTGDVELYARDDGTNYIGMRFRHEVTYWETTT